MAEHVEEAYAGLMDKFLAYKLVEIDVGSMASHCCSSVASFVVFLCVSVCDTRCQSTVLCQNGRLGR